MRIRRVLAGAVAASFVTAGVVALGAGSASAFPSNCEARWGSHNSQAWAKCYAGTGQYRVRIVCDASPDFAWYGDWYAVGSGTPSYATCPGYQNAIAKGYERRGFGR